MGLFQLLKATGAIDQVSIGIYRDELGTVMHDPNIPEWKKLKIIKDMNEMGGYENLPTWEGR